MSVSVSLLGARIDEYEPAEVLADFARRLESQSRARIFFANAHCLNIQRSDRRYADALNSAEYVLPDGSGVLLASRLLRLPIRNNLNGTDLVPEVMRLCAERGRSVYLYGGRPGVAEDAARRLVDRFPRLRIFGTSHGYLPVPGQIELLERLRELRPDVLVVAMGVPAQELWLTEHWEALPVTLGLGVGALLDFLAGRVPRAPLWVRRLGAEWCWRLLQEPGRMWRRYLIGNLSFLYLVARSRWVGNAAQVEEGRVMP